MLHGTAAHRTFTPRPQILSTTMSTSNSRVSGMVARAISNRSIRHSDPTDNTRNGAGMLSHLIINSSSHYDKPTDNASGNRSICNGNPLDNTSADARKTTTVYMENNKNPISIVQSDEVSEIAWKKKAGFVC